MLTPATIPAHKITFYDRVNSNVVHEWLKNVLNDEAYAELLLKRNSFQFTDPITGDFTYDGIIMLHLALSKYNPSVVVGVECLRAKLETIRMHAYNNNVADLCTDFQSTIKEIKRMGGNCESERRYIITALMSGPNAKFNNYIDRINDDVEARSGPHKDITVEEIITSATTKFDTMERTGDWTRVDPRDAKLLALATEATSLKEEISSLKALGTQAASSSSGGSGGSGGSSGSVSSSANNEKVGGVDKWRTIKKADTINMNGRTWYWCDKHVHPQGHFNGLYCYHKPEDHEEWRNKYRKGKGKTTNDTSKKLAISERLKEVLCSKLMLSDEDAENLCQEINQVN